MATSPKQAGSNLAGDEQVAEAPDSGRRLGRRRALQAVGAALTAAAGATVMTATQPELASANAPTTFTSTDGTTACEGDNTFATTPGGIGVQGMNVSNTFAAVEGHNTGGGGSFFGTTGTLPFAAVEGDHLAGGVGVLGSTNSSSNAAVEGDNSGQGPGALGHNTGGGTGVLGVSSNGSISNVNVGVYGQAQGSTGGIGVLGLCSNDVNSTGVYAQSSTGKGFLGYSLSAAGTGAVGINSAGGVGLHGISQGGNNISNYGLVSDGACYINGALTVGPGYPKSAAVRDAGGGLRRLYCMESPESWFEDFGKGKLSNGVATVPLPADFAELIKTDDYHVFLTPRGASEGLYVADQTETSFAVHEQRGGTSSIAFSYRLVAKRKDLAAVRLEHVDEPPRPVIPAPQPENAIPAQPHAPRRRPA